MAPDDAYPLARADGAVGGLEPAFVDVDGVRTRYYEAGEGDTMLLLHGQYFGAGSANTWAPVIRRLSSSFHLLAPDRLACGLTDNPPTRAGYAWTNKFAHIERFLEAMDVDVCHVVGQSRGVGPATYLALRSRVEVATMTVVNSSTLAPPFGDYGHRRTLMHQGSPALRSSSATLVEELRHFLERYSYRHEHLTDEFVQTAAYMQSRPKSVKALKIRLEDMEADVAEVDSIMEDLRREIRGGALTCPVLITWGRNDPATTMQQALWLFDLLSQHNPNVRLHLFDRAGHHLYREYPEEFSGLVAGFVDHWAGRAPSLEAVQPPEYREYKGRLMRCLAESTDPEAFAVDVDDLPDRVDL